jgi:hypothetical protein
MDASEDPLIPCRSPYIPEVSIITRSIFFSRLAHIIREVQRTITTVLSDMDVEVALFRPVRKGEQVNVIDDKGREKVIDLKPFGVMTRGSAGLKAVKAVKFV